LCYITFTGLVLRKSLHTLRTRQFAVSLETLLRLITPNSQGTPRKSEIGAKLLQSAVFLSSPKRMHSKIASIRSCAMLPAQLCCYNHKPGRKFLPRTGCSYTGAQFTSPLFTSAVYLTPFHLRMPTAVQAS